LINFEKLSIKDFEGQKPDQNVNLVGTKWWNENNTCSNCYSWKQKSDFHVKADGYM
jgi:hypothetical protein